MTRIARTASVCLMVLLLILAACSSTPRVVETGQAPEPIPAAYRAMIEAHPDFQMVATLAAKEGKRVDWSKATQSTNPSGRWVAQIPLWWDENMLELLIVTIEHEKVVDVLLSRITFEREMQTAQIAFTDLSTRVVAIAKLSTVEGKAVLQQVIWGIGKGASSISQMLQPNPTEISRLCNWQHPDIVLAITGLTLATQAMYATCSWGWWMPACWGAVAAYGVALVSYYSALRAHGCIR
ncbi:hypothetical protein [Meiothermus sp.]|uniref:hypothetical protein n=1 Tax=Meiothermus sp. TaxID=1955249 RepID=UPI0021DEE85F|nr:hypothetical protein [Meiothermus sp.]GIW33929.1 MAG: hypothetical protein KatS3mg072_1262 [Meiothermus sp.]